MIADHPRQSFPNGREARAGETAEAVKATSSRSYTPLKRGVNEKNPFGIAMLVKHSGNVWMNGPGEQIWLCEQSVHRDHQTQRHNLPFPSGQTPLSSRGYKNNVMTKRLNERAGERFACPRLEVDRVSNLASWT